jgi:hypothetical protein
MTLMITFLLISFGFNVTVASPDTSKKEIITFEKIGDPLNRAAAVYVVLSGDIYIVENGRNRILTLNANGTRKDSLGSRGIGDYSFDRPRGIDATNGMRIYVADTQNRRVQMFDRRGQFLGSLTAPDRSGFSRSTFQPHWVSVNTFGEAFVFDVDSRHILRFNQQGRFDFSIDLRAFDIEFPISALSSHEDTLFLSESRRNVIHFLSSGGNYQGFLMLSEPIISLFKSEKFLWAVSESNILKFDRNGKLLNHWPHSISKKPVGIAAFGTSIYILTEDQLFKARKP